MSVDSVEKSSESVENNQEKTGKSFDMNKVFSALESTSGSGGSASAMLNVEQELGIKARKLISEIQQGNSVSNAAKTSVKSAVIDKTLVKKQDVEFLIKELEIGKSKAEQALSSNQGDLVKAMLALVA